MPTDSQRDASRANGAKSNGPKTEEGKNRSRLNSLKHGRAAKSLVLSIENVDNFRDLVDSYYDELLPRNQAECNIVDDIIISRWRLQRDWAVEVVTYEIEMDNQTEKVNKEYEDLAHAYRFGLAFRALADTSKALQMNSRYETSHRRAYYKAYNTLMQQRAAERRLPNPPSDVNNGPEAPETTPGPAPEPTPQAPPEPPPTAESKNFRTNPSRTQMTPAQHHRTALLALANQAVTRLMPPLGSNQTSVWPDITSMSAKHPVWAANTGIGMQPTA